MGGSFSNEGISINLDPKRLSYSFYKKQDYEPFAIPFGFPVLDDINAKLELKKMDQSITRTVENVILLITMGADPEKGGVNPNNMTAMQNLFKNESVGRVLVSDYTTKAEFIMPELNLVLGPEKYQVLNEDIKQGLQNVIVGEEKFNSTQVKAQIFIDRLKESRHGFLNDQLESAQKELLKEREKGHFNPLVGGVPVFSPLDKPSDKPLGPRKESGRPEGTTGIPLANATYSRANIQKTIYSIDSFIHDSKDKMISHLQVKELSGDQEVMLSRGLRHFTRSFRYII